MTITLSQFEKIDALNNAYIRRGEAPIDAGRDAVRDWMRHEWRLLDALVEVFGLKAERGREAGEWAAEVICTALMSSTYVQDVEGVQ